jgi:hypothetical protein
VATRFKNRGCAGSKTSCLELLVVIKVCTLIVTTALTVMNARVVIRTVARPPPEALELSRGDRPERENPIGLGGTRGLGRKEQSKG